MNFENETLPDNVFDGDAIDAVKELIKQNRMQEALQHPGMKEVRRFNEFEKRQTMRRPVDVVDGSDLPVEVQPIGTTNDRIAVDPRALASVVPAALGGAKAPKRLMAATGVGKSTRLPLEFSGQVSGIVLSIQPDLLMVESIYNYMSSKNSNVVGSYDGTGDLPKRKIVYVDALGFLNGYARDRTMFDGVSVVLLDESHYASAAYTVIKALLYTRGGMWYVFHLTATHLTESCDHMRGDFTVSEVKVEDITVDQLIQGMDHDFQPKNVRGRVLVFVANAEEVSKLTMYYHSKGIRAFSITRASPVEEFRSLQTQLQSMRGRNVVVVADDCVEYGVTLPLDSVFDFFMKETLLYSSEEQRFRYVSRPLNVMEKKQRAGRVGRLSLGEYKFCGKSTVPTSEIDQWQKFRAYVFLTMFNYQPLDEYKGVAGFFGFMNIEKARQLAHLQLHPLVANLFFDGDRVYRNCVHVLKEFATKDFKFSISETILVPSKSWKYYVHVAADNSEVKIPIPIAPDSVFSSLVAYIVSCAIMNDAPAVGLVARASVSMAMPVLRDRDLKAFGLDTQDTVVDEEISEVVPYKKKAKLKERKMQRSRSSSFTGSNKTRVRKFSLLSDMKNISKGVLIVHRYGHSPKDFSDYYTNVEAQEKISVLKTSAGGAISPRDETYLISYVRYWNYLQNSLMSYPQWDVYTGRFKLREFLFGFRSLNGFQVFQLWLIHRRIARARYMFDILASYGHNVYAVTYTV